ncbi:hypothetical protein [Lactococcus garvieae]|nr:hypothetical protein [Lactococcus garvieae]
MKVIAGATLKTAIYIVGVLFLLEVIGLFEKANTTNDGLMTFKMFQGTGVRFVLALAAVAMPTVIFNFILLIANGLVHLVGSNSGNSFDVLNSMIPVIPEPSGIGELFGEILNAITNPQGLFLGVVLYLIGLIIQLLAYVGVWVIIYLRFFEMFVMLILAPIPMASVASLEHRSIAVNYVKRFSAYAFQSVVILVVMGLYSIFSKAAITSMVLPSGGMFSALKSDVTFLSGLIYAVVFVIALFGTIRKSNQLFGIGAI